MASSRIMSYERRFKNTDVFLKFTNNAGYRMLEAKAKELGIDPDYVRLLMAFSHWTYKVGRVIKILFKHCS